jgi:drug/metabolite transporter (DMT)-like permease
VTVTAFALVAAAAALHAVWNALAKRGRDPLLFLWCSFTIPSVLLAPVVVVAGIRGELPLAGWPFAVATMGIHAVYFLALGNAYRHGDFSLAYPLARGLGVGLVPLVAWLALEEQLRWPGLAGIAMVVAGLVLVSRTAGRTASLSGRRKAVPWALLVGLTIGAYSVVDKVGVGHIHPLPYVALLGLGSMTLLAPVVLRSRARLATEWRSNRKAILLAAGFNLTAYLLVLFAFQLAKTGYVVATRELSIVLSVVIGGLWLGEKQMLPRLAGSCAIILGVVLITTAG